MWCYFSEIETLLSRTSRSHRLYDAVESLCVGSQHRTDHSCIPWISDGPIFISQTLIVLNLLCMYVRFGNGVSGRSVERNFLSNEALDRGRAAS